MASTPEADAPLVLADLRAARLPLDFYRRPVLEVARGLVGKVLVHNSAAGLVAGRIVETEAYRGPEDKAAHSAGGRRTKRTEAMWGEAGRAYMFLLYGMHWAFNVVTGEVDQPHAVLVRALEPYGPRALMCQRRKMKANRRELCNGPGKLCAALGLNREHYGLALDDDRLFIAAMNLADVALGSSPRINIDYAEEWVDRPWRYYARGNRYVSVKPRD